VTFPVLRGTRLWLEAVGDEPAYVFGSSGGAITGLALVAHCPGHVQTLVAHEPPLALLLPEAEEARAGIDDVYDTYRDSGERAAWQRVSTLPASAWASKVRTPRRSHLRPRR
jgi:pimeloyl-ACP methyl ester carboxylesterase